MIKIFFFLLFIITINLVFANTTTTTTTELNNDNYYIESITPTFDGFAIKGWFGNDDNNNNNYNSSIDGFKIQIIEGYYRNESPTCLIVKELSNLIECKLDYNVRVRNRGKSIEVRLFKKKLIIYKKKLSEEEIYTYPIYLIKEFTFCSNSSSSSVGSIDCLIPIKECPENCNNNGICTFDGKCICKKNFIGESCNKSFKECPFINNNEQQGQECNGYGKCNNEFGKCICNSNRASGDCSTLKCKNDGCLPHIDSIIPASSRGGIITIYGWFKGYKSGIYCGESSKSCDLEILKQNDTNMILNHKGKSNPNVLYFIFIAYNGPNNQISSRYTLLVNYKSCNSTTRGMDCQEPYLDCSYQDKNSYFNECFGSGTCNTNNGTCNCMIGRTGNLCQFNYHHCPTNEQGKECSGFGICDNNSGLCKCNSNRTGSDCSIIKCMNSSNSSCKPFIESIIPTSSIGGGGKIQINGWFGDNNTITSIKFIQDENQHNNRYSLNEIDLINQFKQSNSSTIIITSPDISEYVNGPFKFLKISIILSNIHYLHYLYYPCNSTSHGINCSLPYFQCPKDRFGNICSGVTHGECNYNTGVCICNNSRGSGSINEIDCSPFKTCPTNDLLKECSGFGTCNNITGLCACDSDKTSPDCSVIKCLNNSNFTNCHPFINETILSTTSSIDGPIQINGYFSNYYSSSVISVTLYEYPIYKDKRLIGTCNNNKNSIKSTNYSINCTMEFGELEKSLNSTVNVYLEFSDNTTLVSPYLICNVTPKYGIRCSIPNFECPKFNLYHNKCPGGICDKSSGRCKCLLDNFGNPTIGEHCSIYNQSISNILQPLKYDLSQVSLIGSFGYTYSNLTVTVGGFNCKILKAYSDRIDIQLPSNTIINGNQTISIYQNGLNYTTIGLFKTQCPKGLFIKKYSWDKFEEIVCSNKGECLDNGKCKCESGWGKLGVDDDDCSISESFKIENADLNNNKTLSLNWNIFNKKFDNLFDNINLTISINDNDCPIIDSSFAPYQIQCMLYQESSITIPIELNYKFYNNKNQLLYNGTLITLEQLYEIESKYDPLSRPKCIRDHDYYYFDKEKLQRPNPKKYINNNNSEDVLLTIQIPNNVLLFMFSLISVVISLLIFIFKKKKTK